MEYSLHFATFLDSVSASRIDISLVKYAPPSNINCDLFSLAVAKSAFYSSLSTLFAFFTIFRILILKLNFSPANYSKMASKI